MDKYLSHLVSTLAHPNGFAAAKGEDVITVSDTVSAAASLYELVRNSLEYEEEHLLRRNAIRRFLKRKFGETDLRSLGGDLLHELIWARYLPNKKVPSRMIHEVGEILAKYQPLFDGLSDEDPDSGAVALWLLDILSCEIEFHLVPPAVDEALAAFAYQDLRERLQWDPATIKPEDRDLQLFIAVHRALLKSNRATLRLRAFGLYYPDWLTAKEPSIEIRSQLASIMRSIEGQLSHDSADALLRTVQRAAPVYLVLREVIAADPTAFEGLLADPATLKAAVSKAASSRARRFYGKIRRGIFRAIFFLFFTKMAIGLAIELPYELFVVHAKEFTPLLTNIFFHPLLLAVLGLSVRIPQRKNTERLEQLMRGVLGLGESWKIRFLGRRPWNRGFLGVVFHALYAVVCLVTIAVIVWVLWFFQFNALSIVFFLLFLSLVMFFGIKLRGTRREYVVVDAGSGFLGVLFDMFFLPIVRVGRWISLRAPRVNIVLFFLDFMVEAPFKALIRLVEGWLAFIREKKEEI